MNLWENLLILSCLIFLSKPSVFLSFFLHCSLCTEHHTSSYHADSYSCSKLSSGIPFILKPSACLSPPCSFLPSASPQQPPLENCPVLIMHSCMKVFQDFSATDRLLQRCMQHLTSLCIFRKGHLLSAFRRLNLKDWLSTCSVPWSSPTAGWPSLCSWHAQHQAQYQTLMDVCLLNEYAKVRFWLQLGLLSTCNLIWLFIFPARK